MNPKGKTLVDQLSKSKGKGQPVKYNQSIPNNISINNFHLNTNLVNFNSGECLVSSKSRPASIEKTPHSFSLQQIITKSVFDNTVNQNKGRPNLFDKTLIDDLRKELNEINDAHSNERKERSPLRNHKPIVQTKHTKNSSLFIKKDNCITEQSISKPKLHLADQSNHSLNKKKQEKQSKSKSKGASKSEVKELNLVVIVQKSIIAIQQKYIEKLDSSYRKALDDLKQNTEEKLKKLNEANNTIKKAFLKVYDTIKHYSINNINEDRDIRALLPQLVKENELLREMLYPPCLTQRRSFESAELLAPSRNEALPKDNQADFQVKCESNNQCTGYFSNSIVYLKANCSRNSSHNSKSHKEPNPHKSKMFYRNRLKR